MLKHKKHIKTCVFYVCMFFMFTLSMKIQDLKIWELDFRQEETNNIFE